MEKITPVEIIEKFNLYLDQQIQWNRSSYDPEAYKNDFFQLFVAAYTNNYFDSSISFPLTGTGIKDAIIGLWITDERPENILKIGLLSRYCHMWDEWKYAWDYFIEAGAEQDECSYVTEDVNCEV